MVNASLSGVTKKYFITRTLYPQCPHISTSYDHLKHAVHMQRKVTNNTQFHYSALQPSTGLNTANNQIQRHERFTQNKVQFVNTILMDMEQCQVC